MTVDFSQAPCIGKWWLFESTDPFDHIEAKQHCNHCPLLDACAQILEEEKAKPLARYGGPEGTWAGQLVGSKFKPIEHGTERGYNQHRYQGSPACRDCRNAHAVQ